MVRGKADWQKVSFSRHILDYWAPYTFTVFQPSSSNFLWFFFPHVYYLDFTINEKNLIIAHKASPVAQRWRICLQCRRSRRRWFHPGVSKILWRRNTRGLVTSCPTHILPNSHHSQPFTLPQGRWKRSFEAPGEPSYCLGELEAMVLRVRPPFSPHTLFPVNHPGTPSAGPTVLSTGCLFAGTAFQVSKLKTSADNPNTKMKKGGKTLGQFF